MANRPSLQSVAIAGAVAISASLIGFAALPQTSGPPTQTRAVALTSGGADIYVPDVGSFQPTVAEGFPPFEHVLQGAEEWNFLNPPSGVFPFLFGTDTQTTIGSFVNDDFLEQDGEIEGEGGSGIVVPEAGSEIDLMNFGGGFENEWANLVDSTGLHTLTDTIITPFGDYTIPLGTEAPLGAASVAAALPADAYSYADLLSSIQNTTAAGDGYLTAAETALAGGDTPQALSDALAGFDDLTVGVQNDLLTNGYAVLTGVGGNAGYDLSALKFPADLASAFAEAQTFAANAQESLSTALTELASGEQAYGLDNLAEFSINSAYGTDVVILGLFDSLLGIVPV